MVVPKWNPKLSFILFRSLHPVHRRTEVRVAGFTKGLTSPTWKTHGGCEKSIQTTEGIWDLLQSACVSSSPILNIFWGFWKNGDPRFRLGNPHDIGESPMIVWRCSRRKAGSKRIPWTLGQVSLGTWCSISKIFHYNQFQQTQSDEQYRASPSWTCGWYPSPARQLRHSFGSWPVKCLKVSNSYMICKLKVQPFLEQTPVTMIYGLVIQ